MKPHCFICATLTFPDDPTAEQKYHAFFLHAQISAFQNTGVQITLIQNGTDYPSLGVPVIRNPILKSLAYNYLLCDANCTGDYWIFLPEDCRITPQGWEAVHRRAGRECFSMAKDPKCLVCRKGIFDDLPGEARRAVDLNFLGKEISHMLVRGELEKHGFHCITPHWPQVSTDPPLWANEYFEMIPGPHLNTNALRGMPALDDYGISGYKANAAKIEELYTKIVEDNTRTLTSAAIVCKGLISKFGPILTEVPYDPSHS